MLRTGIPFDVWLRQPNGVIETAVRMFNERDQRGAQPPPPSSGPQMHG